MQINLQEPGNHQENYFFQAIPNKSLETKEAKQILTKWGLLDTFRIGSFRFNQKYSDLRLDSFLRDLFNSPNVRFVNNNIKFPNDMTTQVKFSKLNCNEVSTQIFDQLTECGAVSGNYIQQNFGDQYEDIQICNEIRELLLIKQSSKYDAFNDNQRKELIIKIFQALVIGGSLNQYEDTLSPYLQWTKNIYKSLVTVRKQAESGNIYIDSTAVQIKSLEKDGFSQDYNPQNFVYVVICPSIRTVNIVSNKWMKFW